MQKARLLHSSEEVAVLAIDPERRQARVRVHGFERTLPLDALVFEEGHPALSLPTAPLMASKVPCQETEVWLNPHLPPKNAHLEVRHGLSAPALYALWIVDGPTWHRLLYFLADLGETQTLQLSPQAHALPWHLALQRLVLPPCTGAPPELSLWHFTIDKSHLYRSTPQKLEPESPPPVPAKVPLADTSIPPPLPDFSQGNPPKILDLHIEKLAPTLKESAPEAILSHQLLTLQRYLRACESRRYASVVVIHGVGDMKLYREVERFCKASGWSLQKLSEPPYLNGASRVYFWKEETAQKK